MNENTTEQSTCETYTYICIYAWTTEVTTKMACDSQFEVYYIHGQLKITM